MSKIDVFIFGFFIGVLTTGFYYYYMVKSLKKNGYLIFEATDKLKNELKNEEKG
jgi:hypothetical protein